MEKLNFKEIFKKLSEKQSSIGENNYFFLNKNPYKIFDSSEIANEFIKATFIETDKTIKQFKKIPAYDEVAKWLTNTEGKGLLLVGDTGTGKSRMALSVIAAAFVLINYYPICIKSWNINIENYKILKQKTILIIDEFGREALYNNFGIKYEILYNLIDEFEATGKTLILTSNMSEELIIKRYGEPFLERIKKMCKIVVFKGESFRI
jgi:DNA replication protein DnaC